MAFIWSFSFHHVNFILPLLQNCPGTQWNVTTTTIRRQVEDLVTSKPLTTTITTALAVEPISAGCIKNRTKLGRRLDCFNPVIITMILSMYLHVNATVTTTTTTIMFPSFIWTTTHCVQTTCDQWFQTHNPLLTPERVAELQRRFRDHPTIPSLEECYDFLSFLFFLKDWDAFRATRLHLRKVYMTWETARDFYK